MSATKKPPIVMQAPADMVPLKLAEKAIEASTAMRATVVIETATTQQMLDVCSLLYDMCDGCIPGDYQGRDTDGRKWKVRVS